MLPTFPALEMASLMVLKPPAKSPFRKALKPENPLPSEPKKSLKLCFMFVIAVIVAPSVSSPYLLL